MAKKLIGRGKMLADTRDHGKMRAKGAEGGGGGAIVGGGDV